MANGYFERGEIYWVRMDNGFGGEQGTGRPGVVVSSDEMNKRNPTVSIAFMTKQPHEGDNYTSVEATGVTSYVVGHQVMSFDKSRFGKCIGKLNRAEQKAVDNVLECVFDLGYVDEEALKAKDREIEARDAVIAEKDTEIQLLKAEMAREREANADEVSSLKIEVTMWQRLYDKALNSVVDMKFAADMALKCRTPEPPKEVPPVVVEDVVVPETPVEVEQPVEEPQPVENERVDINTCTMTALKKLGFSLPMAKKIKEARPFSSVEDLKRVNGLKASLYRVIEPKLCCTPIVVEVPAEEPPVVEVVETPVETPVEKKPDPGFELVDINTAGGKDLEAVGFNLGTAYRITSYRKRNGLFTSIDDLRNVPISKTMIDKYRMYLMCVVPESEEEAAPAEESREADERLNVNEATVTELMNVGFTKAAANRIVAYRRKNGPFREVYDLMKIPDVTGKTLRKMGDRVRV
jgi:competence protein ComEA